MTDTYRSAASIMALKPVEVCTSDGCRTIYQMLLLHKPRKNDAWQLPQGGVEPGENTEQAVLRELAEEAGITSARVLGQSEKIYQYDFPEHFRRFRPDNVCGQKISFVFAIVGSDTVVTVDEKEVDAYAWADPSQLQMYVRRKEYLELIQNLYEEGKKLVEAAAIR